MGHKCGAFDLLIETVRLRAVILELKWTQLYKYLDKSMTGHPQRQLMKDLESGIKVLKEIQYDEKYECLK